jgi:hypothetical protein
MGWEKGGSAQAKAAKELAAETVEMLERVAPLLNRRNKAVVAAVLAELVAVLLSGLHPKDRPRVLTEFNRLVRVRVRAYDEDEDDD